MTDHPYTSFLLTAAGNAVRMQGGKIFCELDGVPAVARCLLAAQRCAAVDEIVVSARAEDVLAFWDLARLYGVGKLAAVTVGGATRQQSVAAGLALLNPSARFAAVHDGARPLVTAALIERVCRAAWEQGAAIPCLPVTDTVKEVEDGFVKYTPNRERLAAAQTPQVFDLALYRQALAAAQGLGRDYTDDSQLFEAMGFRVAVVPGEAENIKLTVPADLAAAQRILHGREQSV